MSDNTVPLREFLDERHRAVMAELKEIQGKQDTTNGRLRGAEGAIIVLRWGYGLGAVIAVAMASAWIAGWWR
jgi:hypothetical protein